MVTWVESGPLVGLIPVMLKVAAGGVPEVPEVDDPVFLHEQNAATTPVNNKTPGKISIFLNMFTMFSMVKDY